jgi:mannose-6-phosphate isomerase-like protein (cupin superfamily)
MSALELAMRRIVTGFDSEGRPTVLSQEAPPVVFRSELMAGYEIADLCLVDNLPLAANGIDISERPWKLEPPVGGLAWRVATRPPESSGPGDLEGVLDEIGATDGRLSGDSRNTGPGSHATRTVDLMAIISGELWLTVGEEEVHLKPGDFVIQGGVPHAWHNRGSEPCVFVALMLSVAD